MEEYQKLVFCILSAPITSFLITLLIQRTRNEKLSIFSFQPEYGLTAQGPFVFWVSIPVIYFFVFGFLSWRGHDVSLTSDGFRHFLTISTLPLALLSISIPLAALISRLHGTKQTAVQIRNTGTQIDLTRNKNNVDAFYAHRKALIDYFDYIDEATYPGEVVGKFKAHPRLHIKFFLSEQPGAGIPPVNPHRFKRCILRLKVSRERIQRLIPYRSAYDISVLAAAAHNYSKLCLNLNKVAEILVLPEIYKDLKEPGLKIEIILENKVIQLHALGNSLSHAIGSYRYCRSFMRVLCEFSGYPVDFFAHGRTIVDKGDNYKGKNRDPVESLLSTLEIHKKYEVKS
ncbi:hypothetical protein PSGK_09580 [Pseudomonas solani]|uniref:hypothetical protein n=1 Tax=Pseudomonas solani TaxID=2731552 RepID=UPI0035BE3B4B